MPLVLSVAALGVFLAISGGFTALTLLTYTFTHTTQDQAIFLQVLHSIVHHGSFAESIYHSDNFLRLHFSPIYILLSPLALVLPGPYLVALFPLATVLACGLLARSMVRRATGSRALAALVLVASLLNPLSVRLMEQGIRETVIAALFLALALDAFERRKAWSFVVTCVLASLCKEDIPLVIVGFLAPAVIERRRGLWLWFPPLYGITAFLLIVQVLMPLWGAQRGQGGLGFPAFAAMGSSYVEIALYVLAHPGRIVLTLLSDSNRAFFAELLGSFWYLPLAAPELLLVPLSQFLEIALSSSRHVAEIHNWYHVPAYPFVVAAFARAVSRADCLARFLAARIRPPLLRAIGRAGAALALAGVLVTSYALTVREAVAGSTCFRGIVQHDPRAGGAGRLLLYRYYLTHLAFHRGWAARIARRLNEIPPAAPVSAQYAFLVALARRDHVTLFPDVEGARFVVLHRSLAIYPLADAAFQQAVWSLPGQGFHLVVEDGGLMIFERGRPSVSENPCLQDCWRYEAEELPPGSQELTAGPCAVRNRGDRRASGLAARASSRGAPLPIGRWVLDLAPGRHMIAFRIRVREIFAAGGYLVRLAAVDEVAGQELASRVIRREDVTLGSYQRHDLAVDIEPAAGKRVEIRVEDPQRAFYLIDTVEVRHHRPGPP